MFDKMKQLMDIKKQADQIKKELDRMTIDVSEVNGIELEITGSQNFRSIRIDESLLGPENKSRLERDLLRSVNTAIKTAQKQAASKMAPMMPGL